MSALRGLATRGFWRRTGAMLLKEFIQLRRDRVSFAMIIMIPLMQLVLFGYAINTTPRDLPTAVLMQETSDLGRSLIAALENTRYFKVTHVVHEEAEFDRLLASGTVLFAIEMPRGFERALRRGDKPALLVAADATDPVAAGSALSALGPLVQTALAHDRVLPEGAAPLFEIRTHARYNPAASTALNIVPGLVGTILTMTMLIFTALSVTREIERGTMESLLAMPITPIEIMLGKIVPYVIVGFVQAALILGAGIGMFGVPVLGNLFAARGAQHPVHHHQSVDRLYVLDRGAEPAPGDADVDDVLPAEHPAVRIHVPVRRHAAVGAMDRRMPAADPLSAHRPRDHAQGFDARRAALRHPLARCAHAGRDDHRGDALPPYARLTATNGRTSSAKSTWKGADKRDKSTAACHRLAADLTGSRWPTQTVPTAPSEAARRRSIAFINWAHALDHYVILIYPTVVIGLEAVYARTYAELIALSTASFVAFGVFSLPAGWLADHWSRRNMMAAFYLGCGVSLIAAGAASGPIALATALFVLGIFAAIYHPVGTAMLVEAAASRGRSMAFNGVCGNLGVAFAAGITAWLAVQFGWRWAFFVPAAVCIVSGFLYLWLVPDERSKASRARRPPPTCRLPLGSRRRSSACSSWLRSPPDSSSTSTRSRCRRSWTSGSAPISRWC